jgi:hypothetical protein
VADSRRRRISANSVRGGAEVNSPDTAENIRKSVTNIATAVKRSLKSFKTLFTISEMWRRRPRRSHTCVRAN